MHGLLRKYYVTDDVLCDAVSSAIWHEKLPNGRKRLLCWQQLPFAFCVRPDVAESRRLAGLEAGYVVEMRVDSATL